MLFGLTFNYKIPRSYLYCHNYTQTTTSSDQEGVSLKKRNKKDFKKKLQDLFCPNKFQTHVNPKTLCKRL